MSEERMADQIRNGAISFPALVKEIKKYESESHIYEKKIKVAVIGSTSIQLFCTVLSYVLKLHGYDPEVYQSEYDGINMTLLQDSGDFLTFSPEYVVILPHYTDVKEYPSVASSKDEYNILLEKNVERQRTIWDNLSKLDNVHVFYCNYVVPYIQELGCFESNTRNSKSHFIWELNERILASKPAFATIIDLNSYASQVGKENWFDFTGYFASKAGFSLNYLLPIANRIARLIDTLNAHIKKCLVLDLDNTLWGDVVSDVGVQGVILDPNDAEGESYRFFQTYVKELKNRGVILAICSKNDESLAKQVFTDNPNMILRLEDIACFAANWDDKATNLMRIAKRLNIGIDSLVFFDDNPVEREIVRKNCPQVYVVDVPDNSDLYVPALFNSGIFDTIEITAEDVLRSNTYIANNQRDELLESVVDYNAYLKALNMEAEIREVGQDNLERFVQLINKSNQFNLRSKRYTEKEVAAMMEDPSCRLYAFYLKDKFSYYGNIACTILKKLDGENQLFIDTLVMSCRVLKRGLETVIFNQIVSAAIDMNCSSIKGEYIRTDRNAMVANFLDEFAFQATYEDDGIKEYILPRDEYHSGQLSAIAVKSDDIRG